MTRNTMLVALAATLALSATSAMEPNPEQHDDWYGDNRKSRRAERSRKCNPGNGLKNSKYPRK